MRQDARIPPRFQFLLIQVIVEVAAAKVRVVPTKIVGSELTAELSLPALFPLFFNPLAFTGAFRFSNTTVVSDAAAFSCPFSTVY